ncbi:MAG: hypothetical protein CFE21_04605 [Bacteroidetes bacterium B1(2017)]|nr:MAG: hypothetical protein CFE21_04605 [Bacteroidetes bacterium B1(2017)]
MLKLSKKICYLALIILASCAQQQPPDGGIKDEKPPQVAGTRPQNKSTKFGADKITIKFDEYVQIKDPSQIVISPILKEKPTIEANGKQIEIQFLRSKPEPNTTYTINFGNSIADINEANVLSSFSYVFSTGDFLDSNTVGGTVVNSFTNKPEKDIMVGLYKQVGFTDSTLQKNYPNYFGKSKETGEFLIENLPDDSFYLVAFKDENLDNKYQKNENVAFVINPILAREETANLALKLFTPESYLPNTLLDTISKQKGKYQLAIYNPTDINITTNLNGIYSQYLRGKNNIDTFNFYSKELQDTGYLKLTITTKDSLQKIQLKSRSKSKYPEFLLYAVAPIKPIDTLKLYSSTPIDSITVKQMQIKDDTLYLIPNYFKQVSNFEWHIYYPFAEGKSYTLLIKDSATKDIYGRYNKSLTTLITSKTTKEFGTIKFQLSNTKFEPILFQLVSDDLEEKVVFEQSKNIPQELIVNYINPGNYKLKVVLDRNKNGKWDNGNLKKREQPEDVFYYNQAITVKANWDIEQSIDIKQIISNLKPIK